MKGKRTTRKALGSPATTQEGRENQLIAAAYNLAEERILNGTASSQEIVHFLRLGSRKARLEEAKAAEEIKLLEAKTAAIESAQKVEAMYAEAIKAFKTYSGADDDDQTEELL